MSAPQTAAPAKNKVGLFSKILAVPVAIIAGLLGYVAVQPPTYRVERSAVIHAPPEVVFAQVNDFHAWQAWSPWAELDPDAKLTFAGESSGKGAKFEWAGNKDVGEGGMTILESSPPSKIHIDLHFKSPMQVRADTVFSFVPDPDGTKVTWAMSGENAFVGRLVCLFMNMDKKVGKDFERGLANMNKALESQGAKPAAHTTGPEEGAEEKETGATEENAAPPSDETASPASGENAQSDENASPDKSARPDEDGSPNEKPESEEKTPEKTGADSEPPSPEGENNNS